MLSRLFSILRSLVTQYFTCCCLLKCFLKFRSKSRKTSKKFDFEREFEGYEKETAILCLKVSENPLLYQHLDEYQKHNVKIMRAAVRPNSEGVYSEYSFTFGEDDEEDIAEEKEEIEYQRKTFQEIISLEEHKHEEIEYLRKLGEGAYGRTYLFRILSEGKRREDSGEVRSFVMKVYNDLHLSQEQRESYVEKDSLYIPYHRNVAPILFHSHNFKINYRRLPDFENYWRFVLGDGNSRIRTSVIVMRYHRKDLFRFARERNEIKKPFENLEVCNILRGILSGAKHLNDHMIVHRDLYPSNIFLSEVYGRIWIGDFGCSLNLQNNSDGFRVHIEEDILYSSSNVSYIKKGGYENYLAPEISSFDEARDSYLDYSKSDLYSCGMIGKFLIFHKDFRKYSPTSLNDEFDWKILDHRVTIIEFIEHLLVENPKDRIGFEESLREIKKLTTFHSNNQTGSHLQRELYNIRKKHRELVGLENESNEFFEQGRSHVEKGDITGGMVLFRRSLSIRAKHFPEKPELKFECLYQIGLAKISLRDFSSAVEDFHECLKALEFHRVKGVQSERYYEWESNCYLQLGRIGILREDRKDLEVAKFRLEKCKEILMKHFPNDCEKNGFCDEILGDFYAIGLGRRIKALELYKSALDNYKKDPRQKCTKMESIAEKISKCENTM